VADKDKEQRVVEARLKLRERFLTRAPAPSPGAAQGSGAGNRHGMPRLPVGQSETKGWPVLDLGRHPQVPKEKWTLTIDGACESPLGLGWQDFLALEQTDDVSDFHCVTTWSKFDVPWRGVRFSDLAALAMPTKDATWVLCHAYDGYTTNLPLAEALEPDVLLVHSVYGQPLPIDHGGPVRMITPQLYAWKGAKWISRIQFCTGNILGYWEERGYSSTADPWQDDRYD
jgi:DMSO/TMAO reductase YedYZ molybdopterin-dependent catalytic subunit